MPKKITASSFTVIVLSLVATVTRGDTHYSTSIARTPQGIPAAAFPSPSPVPLPLSLPASPQRSEGQPISTGLDLPLSGANQAGAPQAGAPQTPEAAQAETPARAFIRDIRFNGNIDAYYAYNFNQPTTSNPLPTEYGSAPPDQNIYLVPNNYHDEITLNFAQLKIAKEARPVGFRVDLGFGPWADALSGNNNTLNLSDSGTRPIMQAYLGYRFDFGLLAEVGKFKSDMGFESTDPSENWNYSMTFLSRYLLPYWNTGLRLGMPVNKAIQVSGYIYNGLNSFYENNGSKMYGLQCKIAVTDRLAFVANGLAGVDITVKGDPIAGTPLYTGTQDYRNIYEGIGTYKVLESLKVAVDYVTASESINNKSSRPSNSVAFFGNWNFARELYFIPRYEFYTDSGSTFSTQQVQQINSVTLGLEVRPADELRLQAEFRFDSSNGVPYTTPLGPAQNQSVATIAALLAF